MARPLRLEFPGALWHVTSRGNGRAAIFTDDEDREAFLRVLARVVGMFRWKLHAYVLMGNHYHLLVETPEPNLSRGMRQINGIYTQGFNRRHYQVGHLFQGRFKGILVERESHLLELARYIVLNPVRAGLAGSAAEWHWSSYKAAAGLVEAPNWLDVSLLEMFGRRAASARLAYSRFVAEGTRARYQPWKEVRDQLVLGGEEFVRRLDRLARDRPVSPEVPKRQRHLGRPTMAKVIEAVAAAFGTSPADVSRPRSGLAREAVAYLARVEGTFKLAEIGEVLGVRPWSASHLFAAAERRLAEDPAFRRKTERARGELS